MYNLKAFFTTPTPNWTIGTEVQVVPGRSLTKTTVRSGAYNYERVTVSDLVDVSEIPLNLVDSLNNAFSVPNTQYQLSTVENNGKITIYFPFFDNSKTATIEDIIFDVNATVTYDQETATYKLENVTPITGNIVFEPYAPTTAQGNNPATNSGDINFDRATIALTQASLYCGVTIRPDKDLQRTRPNSSLPNATAALLVPENNPQTFLPGPWLNYAQARQDGTLFKSQGIAGIYYTAGSQIQFTVEER